jgi:hypothetical protein
LALECITCPITFNGWTYREAEKELESVRCVPNCPVLDQLDSRDGAHGVLELFESQNRPQARLDVTVILLNEVVEILA